MTPVINPLVFYAIDIVDSIKNVFTAVIIFGTACLLFYIMAKYFDSEEINKKFVTRILAALLVLGFLLSFIPTSATITKMILAQNVTYERVEAATNTVKDVYEDIMELFEEDTE